MLSIERYFLINMAMDTLLLTLGLRAAGIRIRWRVLLAGIVGGVYAVCCGIFPPAGSLPGQGMAMLLMLMVAAGNIKCSVVAAMAAVTLLAGGVLQFMSERSAGLPGFLAAVTAWILLAIAFQDHRRFDLRGLHIAIRVFHGKEFAAFEALIDTGNRLKEPFSGLPVLIVEAKQLGRIAEDPLLHLRRIPYGGIGGCGFMRAFRPKRMECRIDGKWKAVDDVWVALYPGRMSGDIHALAPPVLALRRKE